MNIGNFEKIPPQQGWQCPICGRVYSPTTAMCFYCGNEETTSTTTYTIKWPYQQDTIKKNKKCNGEIQK